MTAKNWSVIASWSLVALGFELFIGFALSFNPGWANGWPSGMPIDVVWSIGLSVIFLVLLMTVAIGVGALASGSNTQMTPPLPKCSDDALKLRGPFPNHASSRVATASRVKKNDCADYTCLVILN
jgi:hypothetical protein